MTRSPRSRSPAVSRGPEEPGRMLSPLRAGQTANETQDMYNPSNGAPRIMRSAPTGSPLSPKEPGEFPFNSPSTANGASIPTEPLSEVPIRTSKPSSHTSNVSTGSYYPPFAPISRHPTEGESDVPRDRKSVQFARSATFTSDQPAASSRQQSWEVDEGDGKGKERSTQGTSLMGKLRALASPSQGHSRSHSGAEAVSNTTSCGSMYKTVRPMRMESQVRVREPQDRNRRGGRAVGAGSTARAKAHRLPLQHRSRQMVPSFRETRPT
jgi:phospholipase D1/2